jgi:hypothetical protein
MSWCQGAIIILIGIDGRSDGPNLNLIPDDLRKTGPFTLLPRPPLRIRSHPIWLGASPRAPDRSPRAMPHQALLMHLRVVPGTAKLKPRRPLTPFSGPSARSAPGELNAVLAKLRGDGQACLVWSVALRFGDKRSGRDRADVTPSVYPCRSNVTLDTIVEPAPPSRRRLQVNKETKHSGFCVTGAR